MSNDDPAPATLAHVRDALKTPPDVVAALRANWSQMTGGQAAPVVPPNVALPAKAEEPPMVRMDVAVGDKTVAVLAEQVDGDPDILLIHKAIEGSWGRVRMPVEYVTSAARPEVRPGTDLSALAGRCDLQVTGRTVQVTGVIPSPPSPQPLPGTIRISAPDGLPQNTRLEVWTGAAWAKMDGVRSFTYRMDAAARGRPTSLSIELDPVSVVCMEAHADPGMTNLSIAGFTPDLLRSAKAVVDRAMDEADAADQAARGRRE